ncbi:uncharacterized protein LOC132035091 [Lycium ferocissimum]|uniref:uncharacterized protein LOC132035091 n=1 Tax=Lycium ferocissimum TaxID=112874 RepID=UPI002814A503|nr:uncharacterized protein LOC132035091 [Lycium ferocissimum]
MAPYEVLYGRKYRSLIVWFEVGETELLGPDLVYQAIEKVKLIQERLKTAQSDQKSYTAMRRRDLEFQVDQVAYKLELPQELVAVHPVFCVSMLRKCVGDPSLFVLNDSITINDSLAYEEVSVKILNRQVRKLRTKEVASVKVL